MGASTGLPPVDVICPRCRHRWQSTARRLQPVHCPQCKHRVRVKRPAEPHAASSAPRAPLSSPLTAARTASTSAAPPLAAVPSIRDWITRLGVTLSAGPYGCEIAAIPGGQPEPCPSTGDLNWRTEHADGSVRVCTRHYVTLESIASPPDCHAALLAHCWLPGPHRPGLCEIVKPVPGGEPRYCPHPASVQIRAGHQLAMICTRCAAALTWQPDA
jgi:hypothetical protein